MQAALELADARPPRPGAACVLKFRAKGSVIWCAAGLSGRMGW